MNWTELGGLASVVMLVIVLIGGGVMWGQLKQMVSDLAEKFLGHDNEIKSHGDRLGGVEIDVATLKGWKDGYESAARVATRGPGVL